MNRIYISCVTAVFLMAAATGRAATVYVDVNASGPTFNGTSWANAHTSIVAALAGTTAGDLWVATGTYAEASTIPMKSGVNLYGGFTNGMASLVERDWNAHPALLDGLGARTVILGANNAILDGFVITNGAAAASGGGMINNSVSPLVRNCTFVNNVATVNGGAVHNLVETADPVFSNCTFRFNRAASGGVAYNDGSSDPVFQDCVFFGNRANNNGGVFIQDNSVIDMRVINSTFTSNSATLGGVMYQQTGTGVPLAFSNCVFNLNSATTAGGVFYLRGGYTGLVENCYFLANTSATGGAIATRDSPRVIYRGCVFAGNTATTGGTVGTTHPDAQTYESCVFSANRASGNGGAFGAAAGSTHTMRACLFAGNEAAVSGGGIYNNSTSPVVENCVFAGNVATTGGGAFNAGASLLRLTHSTFRGNRAATSGGALTTGTGVMPITNAIFWGNSAGAAFSEIHEPTANRADVNFCYVAGGWTGGLGANNFSADPLFPDGGTGEWERVGTYVPAVAQTTLTDSDAVWATNALAGLVLQPDTGAWPQFAIASNTVDTIYVWGNATQDRAGNALAGVGDPYRILNARPQPASPVVDQGVNIGVTRDYAGNMRPVGGGYDIGAFEVVVDVRAPGDVTGLAAQALHARIALTWTNPPALDLAGVLLVRREGAAPSGTPTPGHRYTQGEPLGDGVVVGITNGTRWVDHSLTIGTDYHYRLFAFDAEPNYSAGVAANAVPLDDTLAPGPVSGLSAVGGTGVVELAWMNPAAADFAGVLVVRGVGADPGGTPETGREYAPGVSLGGGVVVYVGAASNATPGAASAFIDGGLADDTVYAYRVFAFDPSLNHAPGVAASAATDPDIVPPPNVSGVSIRAPNAWVDIAWTNPPAADFEGVLMLRKVGGVPVGAPSTGTVYVVGESLGDGVVVFNGTGSDGLPGAGSNWADTNVLPGVTYGYRLFARDERPNYASGVGGSATVPRIVNYVDASATGANNGTSWTNAFTSLATALAATRTGTNIWVSRGTYSPGSFQLQANVALYGGFTNGMSSLVERNPDAYPTVLSGGGPVVLGAPGARLDGFTVTGGNGVNGGGFYMSGGTITVANCTFSNNQATVGGGLHLVGVHATIEGCRIIGNRATGWVGGGIHAEYVYEVPAGVIRNTVFMGNRCEGNPDGKSDGGGLSLHSCPYRVENCTFYGNVTSRRGGGIKIYQGNGLENYVIKNCILWNNRLTEPPTGDFGGWELAIQQDAASVPVTVLMSFTDWSPDQGDRLYTYYRDGVPKHVFSNMIEADPAFADPAAGDLHLKSKAGRWFRGTWVADQTNSPCIDAGDPLSDWSREPKPNGARINMGAYGNTEQASRSGEGSPGSGYLLLVR